MIFRFGSAVLLRNCPRLTCWYHPSTSNSSLAKVKPTEEELPSSEPVFRPKQRDKYILDLSDKAIERSKNLKKKNISLIHDSEWVKMEPRGVLAGYLGLSKSKLTLLITTTAVGGFMMAPTSVALGPLAACAAGTALLSSAANACNQLLEAPYDAQMKRTQNRVLVVHRFTPLHAFSFAAASASTGAAILYYGANPLAAFLGLVNLGIYVGVYTPMKRTHIGCTWAGAVVGAIPPLMGYAAAAGSLDPAAWCLAAILYSWQFPHFNGLSWNLRSDYSRAGYRVMCVTNERLCRVTSFRHSLALVGLCSIVAPLTDLTTATFAWDSLLVNLPLLYISYKFYKAPNAKNSRQLFFFSLLYLPLIILLMIVSNFGRNELQKKPLSERVQNISKLVDF